MKIFQLIQCYNAIISVLFLVIFFLRKLVFSAQFQCCNLGLNIEETRRARRRKVVVYRSDISWNNLSKFLFQIFNDVILQKEDVRVSFSDKNMLSDIYEIDTKARLHNRTRVCLFSSFSRRIGRSFTHRLCKNRVMSVRVFLFFFY